MGRRRSPPPPPPAAKTKAEVRQEKEDVRLSEEIKAKKNAMRRKKYGRASLISFDERGITDTLGG